MLIMTLPRYISNIQMPGGTIKYIPLHPPEDGSVKTSSAANWTINYDELESAIGPKTRMIVSQSFACLLPRYGPKLT